MSDEITIVLSDGNITVSKKVLKLSTLITDMLEESSDDSSNEINLKDKVLNRGEKIINLDVKMMGKVLDFCKYHSDNPMDQIDMPLKSGEPVKIYKDEWDAKYIDIPREDILDLITVANYLDVHDLLYMGSAKIASLIRGKTKEECATVLEVNNDFTPEQEEEIIKTTPWATF